MKKLFITVLIILLGSIIHEMGLLSKFSTDDPIREVAEDLDDSMDFNNWIRPDGPVRVGIQVGHWKNEEVPEELENLRGNSGASAGGKFEWEVNHAIAAELEKILEEKGIVVDLLPATIPPRYYADAFVAIHADGNEDTSKSGFKAAASRRLIGDKHEKLLTEIEQSYQEVTGLEKDPNITRNMRGYYAFRWWRYEHALHPMTPSVILETGFLTSPEDRELIVDQPTIPAQAIANGITEYLRSENLLKS